jgi:hypothetical protein
MQEADRQGNVTTRVIWHGEALPPDVERLAYSVGIELLFSVLRQESLYPHVFA